MFVSEEITRAILAERMREARQLRLERQALRARKDAADRGQRPARQWSVPVFRTRASGRARRALGRA